MSLTPGVDYPLLPQSTNTFICTYEGDATVSLKW